MIPITALVVCSWLHPGADPYTGSIDDAMQRMGVDRRARAEIALKIEAHHADERLAIGARYVESESFEFGPFMEMSSGRDGLCYGIDRYGWVPGHVELGNLFCAPDGSTCIAIPDVCGNPTLLFNRRPRTHYSLNFGAPSSGPAFIPSAPPALNGGPNSPGAETNPSGSETERTVDEPPTWALLLFVGALLAAFTHFRKGKA